MKKGLLVFLLFFTVSSGFSQFNGISGVGPGITLTNYSNVTTNQDQIRPFANTTTTIVVTEDFWVSGFTSGSDFSSPPVLYWTTNSGTVPTIDGGSWTQVTGSFVSGNVNDRYTFTITVGSGVGQVPAGTDIMYYIRGVYSGTRYAYATTSSFPTTAPSTQAHLWKLRANASATYNSKRIDGNYSDWQTNEIVSNDGSSRDVYLTWDATNFYVRFNTGFGNGDILNLAVDTDPGTVFNSDIVAFSGATFRGYLSPEYVVQSNSPTNLNVFPRSGTGWGSATSIYASGANLFRSGASAEFIIPRSNLGSPSITNPISFYFWLSNSSDQMYSGFGTDNYPGIYSATARRMRTAFSYSNSNTGLTISSSQFLDHNGSETRTLGFTTGFRNLYISNNSTTTSSSGMSILGGVTISSTGALILGNQINVAGNWDRHSSGTFTPSSNTVQFNGTSPQTITVSESGGTASFHNLNIDNSAGVSMAANTNCTISGALTLTSGKLNIGANTLTLAGTVSRTSGFLRGSNSSNIIIQGSTAKTLFFDQGTDGSHLNPTTGTNSINNLTLSSNGNLVLGNKLNLNGTLTTATGTTLNTGDGLLVFRNTATTTSRIADLTSGSGTITGTAISEIYLHAQRRAWRFITNPTPIAGGTIANNWQSAFGFGSGYGTNIYGPVVANGLNSPSTPGASMMKFNSALGTLGAYDNVTNTNVDLDGTYFMFVRGDKNVVAVPNGTPAAFTPTTLASKGTIKTGAQTVTLNGINGRYGAIPNPYLSPVDVSLLTYTGIAGNNASYHWDPSIGNFGGWVSVNSTNWASTSDFRRYMQTGQSALVLVNNATASVVFNEDDKASTKTTQQTGAGNSLQDNFKTTLFIANTDGTKTRVDEMFVAFKNGYNPNFDGNEDAVKMNNSGENLSSKRNNTLIAIEARPYIQNHDSIFMNFTNTRVANYEFEFNPSNFDATVTNAKLVDKFLNTETPISLSANTTVPFSITSTTGSNAADRFMIVFEGTGALPNKNFTVTGEKLGNNKVKINWEAQAETGVREYTLEKSTDGVNYQTVNTQAAKNGNVANSYTYTDNSPVNGVNYYRVKTTQLNDIERYSQVITLNIKHSTSNTISVFPNPVKGNTIGLQLQDLEKGMYSVRILSIEGKEVYKQQLQVSGSNLNTTINPTTKLASGTYTLQVVGKNNSYTSKLLVD